MFKNSGREPTQPVQSAPNLAPVMNAFQTEASVPSLIIVLCGLFDLVSSARTKQGRTTLMNRYQHRSQNSVASTNVLDLDLRLMQSGCVESHNTDNIDHYVGPGWSMSLGWTRKLVINGAPLPSRYSESQARPSGSVV
ncbi:hypothetical protein RRG08_002348 [Elysia crispata]|uniref:Uncharacterized protein n=1 Tax=Elysia crispata TaxID=231223 RepID=A0AAE0ZC11_9GAST|nr:hypothetical protein RRG08_002348 [Elysia crispata]